MPIAGLRAEFAVNHRMKRASLLSRGQGCLFVETNFPVNTRINSAAAASRLKESPCKSGSIEENT
jgi:hypothetical protein